jgi:hypothetical protein
MLENLLFGESATATGRQGTLVVDSELLPFEPRRIDTSISALASGEHFAYALGLDTPWLKRLVMMSTLRVRLRRAERAITKAGGQIVGRYGVEPNLASPFCVFELQTTASEYAGRCLRPEGTARPLRRIASWWFGCDPALGAIVVLARKP